jgi:hypothetical protein
MRLPRSLRFIAVGAASLVPAMAFGQEAPADGRLAASTEVKGELTGIASSDEGAFLLVRTGQRDAEQPRALVIIAPRAEVANLMVGEVVTLRYRNEGGTLWLVGPIQTPTS